jgi:ergothioneine biosynthesis protein EgtB
MERVLGTTQGFGSSGEPAESSVVPSLVESYQAVRAYTEALCAPLKTEDYIPQPAEFVSPPKWHLAHSSWFFEEMVLKQFLPDYQIFDPGYAYLFNSYYQSLGERAVRNQRGCITRPGVDEVYAYRRHVDEHMIKLLSSSAREEESLRDLVILGLNHEQQHQELLITDLKFTFSINPLFPVYDSENFWDRESGKDAKWISIPESMHKIGHQEKGFCFDNELGAHEIFLPAFELASEVVKNGEFIAFIEAGGYEDFRFWLDEGWSWLQENKINAPLYWEKRDKRWHHFTLAGFVPIEEEAVLSHVSFFEAQAFASWKKLRLPTEFEWEAAMRSRQAAELNWGKRWEWTASAYLPYPGFKIAEGAVGEYNGKFMVNQMVLRGASVATSAGHGRISYRNFFHPQHRWQYTGIRLARTV